MNIKPLADRVLIEPAPAETKTDFKGFSPRLLVKEGDKVLYGKYAGTELELDGAKYLIMRQSDVVAVMG